VQEIRQGVEGEGVAFVEQGQRFRVDSSARARDHEQRLACGWEVGHSVTIIGPGPFVPAWVGPAFVLQAAAVIFGGPTADVDEFPAFLDDMQCLMAEKGIVYHKAEFEAEEERLILRVCALDNIDVLFVLLVSSEGSGGAVGEGEPAFPWREGVRNLDTLGCAGGDAFVGATVLTRMSSSFSFRFFPFCVVLREAEERQAPEEGGEIEEFEEGADVRAGRS
jgi:hypothetical protein